MIGSSFKELVKPTTESKWSNGDDRHHLSDMFIICLDNSELCFLD